QRPEHLLLQHLGEAQNGVQRRAQLMAGGDERVLAAGSLLLRLVPGFLGGDDLRAQVVDGAPVPLLYSGRRFDILEADQHAAIGQRKRLRLKALAADDEIGATIRWCQTGYGRHRGGSETGAAFRRQALQQPLLDHDWKQFAESPIARAELSIRSEIGDRFGDRVKKARKIEVISGRSILGEANDRWHVPPRERPA